jgi:hypothetical protein
MEEAPKMVEALVSAYINIRDAKDRLNKELEGKIKELDEQLSLVEAELIKSCQDIGANSIRTEHGTAMMGLKSRYWTNDWESFYRIVKDNSAFELLEKRIHQTNMKSFLDENPDLFPEGLNIEREYKITVRRKN